MPDTTAPTVLITDNVTGIVNRYTKSSTTDLRYTLVFSEDVTGLDASDFLVINGTVSSVTGSGSSWAVSVTPWSGVASGVISLTLKDAAVVNQAGNPNALTTDASQTIDTAAPVAPKLVTNANFNSLVDPQVTFATSMGTVVFELNSDQAPVTVANLLAYVNTGFYDGTIFHRVVDLNSTPNHPEEENHFVVQGGGFNTGLAYKTPTYGPIVLESNNGLSNLKYTLAMARTTAANSATDQFYVNADDNTFLNYASTASPGYAVFGKVVSGFSVIDAMAQVTTTTVTTVNGAFTNVPVTEVTTVTARQTLAGSAVSNTGVFTVSDLEAGARWAFSLNAGANWAWGTGNTLTVPVGSYSPGAIRVAQFDAAGNWSVYDGLFTSALVVETTAPFVTGLSPADAATGIALGSDIVVTFSENILRGTGAIVLKTAAGITVATYNAATSPNLTIAGNKLTINPSADLSAGTHYLVEFAAGSLKDLAGNPYAGTTGYDFTTVGLTVTGTNGDNQLQGTAGDDTFSPGLGNDTVNGGAGTDTVILPMFPNVFAFTENSPGQVSGSYGTGTPYTLALNDVELARFGTTYQTTIPLSTLVSGAAQEQLARMTDLYLAFFGRAPDVGGLEYWQEQLLEVGKDFTAISKDFAFSDEAQALFPQTGSNRDFVRTVYVNCFGREPDAGGWDYWTAVLDGKGVTDLSDRGIFVGNVILGAYAPTSGPEDRTLMTNRHEAALYYVNKLSVDLAEGFDAGINALLARVTGDPLTEDKAERVIDHVFANPVTLSGVMNDPALLDSIWGA